MHISVAPEILRFIGPIALTNSALSAILLVFATSIGLAVCGFTASALKPSRFQLALEDFVLAFKNISDEILHDKSDRLFPFLMTFFVFVLVSNWFGLLPITGPIEFEVGQKLIPLLRAPSTDLSATLALAFISVFGTNFLGFKFVGFSYLSKYINLRNPLDMFVGLLELISELGKILSFSFRLFGNIFAGEVLLVVITYLTYGLGTLPFYLFEIFVGFIQAFAFFILTTAFISLAVQKH